MTPREQDQQAALQAALEDLTRVKAERDELAAVILKLDDMIGMTSEFFPSVKGLLDITADPVAILAAHDRQVAARVLLERAPYLENQGSSLLYRTAGEYEDGEREVPGE